MLPHDKQLTSPCYQLGCNAPVGTMTEFCLFDHRIANPKCYFHYFLHETAPLVWQTSVFTLCWAWSLQSSYFNPSSPLFSVHQPVCGMASFRFLHAPFSIVSISWAFSPPIRTWFFSSHSDDTRWWQTVKRREHVELQCCWTHNSGLWDCCLLHRTRQTYGIDAVVSAALILTKRECNYSN